MPISRYIETSNLARPGVCTSSTRPASPYEGMVIYETDTDRTLVWNASAWVAPNSTTANPPGFEYIGQATVTTQSSLTLNQIFSASYESYRLVIRAVSDTTNTSLRMRFVNSAGTPTATNYLSRMMWYDPSTNASTFTASLQSTTEIVLGGAGGPEPALCTIDIGTPFETEYSTVTGSFTGVFRASANAGGIITGINQLSNSYTGIRLFGSSGNITCGVRAYGYRQG